MTPMLTIQRRHAQGCPDRKLGPDYLKCRGHCALRICGTLNGQRVRKSLKTRDLRPAARRLTEMEDRLTGKPRKTLAEAVEAFHAQHADKADETMRKYKRILAFFSEFCASGSLHYIDQVDVEVMDRYRLWRDKTNWTWIKEIELLRQFFEFCRDREWTTRPRETIK